MFTSYLREETTIINKNVKKSTFVLAKIQLRGYDRLSEIFETVQMKHGGKYELFTKAFY